MALLSSLTNRIFLATATLAMLAIGFAVYFVTGRIIGEAEAELARGLIEAGKLVEQHRTTLVDTFTVEAQLIADLPRLKAAVDTRDPPTVQPIASENQALIGADLFVVTDRSGRVLSALGAELQPGMAVADRPGIKPALSGQKFNSFWPTARGVLQVVTVPIAIGLGSPEILGTLSVGFLMDDQLATQFKSLTDSEVAFAIGGEIRAATVPTGDHSALAALLGSEGVTQITLNGDEYSALVQPLLTPSENGGAVPATLEIGVRPPSGTASAGPHVPAAVILRSRTQRLRVLNELFAGLGGAALLAVILAIGLSYGVARTVTRPLATITAAMREMASTGDLTRKIDLPGGSHWQDEDTSLLARTFNTLTDSIARFQHEAAHRERLSSLGRLSTVIAHEVRNPLMIIKAALRTIRREEATPEEVKDATTDIDEEVRRLNRVVNDVLDFARPIKFDLAPVDLNALCAECATATGASGRGPVVRVIGDPALRHIVTDADRLRIALVNIFVNAQHAVADHRGSDGHANLAVPLPEVEVRTARANSKIRIVVSDRGGGIPAKDVSRIFDPYFTTKRTGTGLGLAIAKNIVEGLGGSIIVEIRPGEGTDMRVELPDTGTT